MRVKYSSQNCESYRPGSFSTSVSWAQRIGRSNQSDPVATASAVVAAADPVAMPTPARAEATTKSRRVIMVTSEAVLECELNGTLAELARDLAERSAVRVVVRHVPVRVIQHVEGLDAELHLVRTADADALADPQIEVPRRRVAEQIARLNAERPCCRPRKCRRVEPLRRCRERCRIDVRIADQVPELVAAARADSSEVVVAPHREG